MRGVLASNETAAGAQDDKGIQENAPLPCNTELCTHTGDHLHSEGSRVELNSRGYQDKSLNNCLKKFGRRWQGK